MSTGVTRSLEADIVMEETLFFTPPIFVFGENWRGEKHKKYRTAAGENPVVMHDYLPLIRKVCYTLQQSATCAGW